MKSLNKNIISSIAAIAILFILSLAYFPDSLKGEELKPHDVLTFKGMAKELQHYREASGDIPLWTNSMFGGMPAYLILVDTKNLFGKINMVLNLWFWRPVSFLFLYLLCFYIALLCFGVNRWLSVAGAIAFGFSTYFLIIIDAGHMTKSVAIAYMAPLIGGVYLAYNKNMILGSFLAGFFLALQLLVNHLQITYYTLIIVLLLGLFSLYRSINEQNIKKWLRITAFMLIPVSLAIGSNINKMYHTYDYGKDSIRGKSELSFNKEDKTSGLDYSYATAWSYGKMETMTLLVPRFVGGSSGEPLDNDMETKKILSQAGYGHLNQFGFYWGEQPFTSGPVYVGASIVLLFIFGFFITSGYLRWWLLVATIISILLSWGKNIEWLTNFLMHYMPGYNKFRTVSMALVIAEFTIPLLAILGINKIIRKKISKEQFQKAMVNTAYTFGGLFFLFAILAPFLFLDFTSEADKQRYAPQLLSAIIEDRETMLWTDVFRSLIMALLAAGAVYMYFITKLKPTHLIIALSAIFLIDLWPINKNYLNSGDFVKDTNKDQVYQASRADQQILQDSTLSFRVYNTTVSPFNDASTSYFHKSIGGYHGAKMRRYQELIENHIQKGNMAVINMLNTKYIIQQAKDGKPTAVINPGALGNAWLAGKIEIVENADEEITAMNEFDPSATAIVDKRFERLIDQKSFPANGRIRLVQYHPDSLSYLYQAESKSLVVFSEIYYDKGWKAYIDGQEAEYFRANYVLRAMIVPAGKHTITFRFDPPYWDLLNTVSLISSLLLILAFFSILGWEIYKLYRKEKLN